MYVVVINVYVLVQYYHDLMIIRVATVIYLEVMAEHRYPSVIDAGSVLIIRLMS